MPNSLAMSFEYQVLTGQDVVNNLMEITVYAKI